MDKNSLKLLKPDLSQYTGVGQAGKEKSDAFLLILLLVAPKHIMLQKDEKMN